MAATDEENWFGQTNKYKYQDLMIALYEKDTISLKTAHAKLGGTGVWIDSGRFTKGTRLHNPDGLFDLFGEYSGQTADEVRDLMIVWIYDNYRKVKSWTRMAMQHKNIEINRWLEDMQKTTTHGDDIALYILSRMFNKHVFVHNSTYGWSTLPYRLEDNYQDVVKKCDLELVFLKCWAFGEVKKIRTLAEMRKPTDVQKVSGDTANVIPGSVACPSVITGNVSRKSKRTTKQTLPAPPKKVIQCTSSRKRRTIDYLTLDKESDIPSPPRKRRRPNLLRKPSKMVIAAHKRCKQMSPLGTTTGIMKTVTTTVAPTPSTSSVSTAPANPIGTVMVEASAEETKTAIAALLSLGNDLSQEGDIDVTAENEMLAPINPNVPPTSKPKVTSTDDNSTAKPVQPVPVYKRFVTVEYKLKRKRRRTRKFRCGKCDQSFDSQRGVNKHFKDTHPPVKCDFCDRSFACPASMLKHRYSHYETMLECDTCGRGFQFPSQLTEHRRIHQVIGDWVCFKPGCGK